MKLYSNKKIYFISQSLPDFCELIPTDSFSKKYLIENQIKSIFIRSNEKITKEILEGTQVEFIATATSGTDHIQSGIPHYYAPGSNANSVAEYVVYSICKYLEILKEKPENKKIGIIGFGNIGKLVANYSNQLGIEVLVNDPPLQNDGYTFPSFVTYVDLNYIFEHCDIITNHVPLTKIGEYSTFNLINKHLLDLIKDNTLFIHTSRGGVVNESDLKSILTKKKIFVSIDVWENEPHFDLELAKNSMFATPHIAGYSYDGKIKASIQVLHHFRNHFGIEVDFTLLNNELKEHQKIAINEFQNIEDLTKYLEKFREFSNDAINKKNLYSFSTEQLKSYFIEFRANYPKRREILQLPD